ncbi:hemopexin repeat-containing protein [Chitinibacter sp. ZOR0017]|uniref:hemopexin repeat-containing protein n=1 Tax=Chitinibacter sp. ZOR0017 TaxID=1339254 RepID=UPI000645F080|nr:hemopexin repeat-containing protein [Chitinibacter sp. ZOR0017]
MADGRYLRYDKSADQVESGYPKAIDDNSWPGLGKYAQQIAAILRWTGGKMMFFLKDGSYLRYDLWANSIDAGYPRLVTPTTLQGLAE